MRVKIRGKFSLIPFIYKIIYKLVFLPVQCMGFKRLLYVEILHVSKLNELYIFLFEKILIKEID